MLKLNQFIGMQTNKQKFKATKHTKTVQEAKIERKKKYTKEIEMWHLIQNKHTDPAPPIDMKRNIL